MFDVQKFVASILAFVNFFVARLVVAGFVAGLLYEISGWYYFDLAKAHISSSLFNEENVKSYINSISDYVGGVNVQNAIFVVVIIVSISIVDILYRFIGALGSFVPPIMSYDYGKVTAQLNQEILQTWRYYANKFDPAEFLSYVQDKASAELEKTIQTGLWKTLFDYSKSFIVIMVVIYAWAPGPPKMSFPDVAYYAMWLVIWLVVCTVIESGRVFNDMFSALRRTTQGLRHEAIDAPISDTEFQEKTKGILRPTGLRDWFRYWQAKCFCVTWWFGISYILTATDWRRGQEIAVQSYRNWRQARKEREKARLSKR